MNPTDGWSERGSGLQNWYGDDARVQQSIIDKAVSVIFHVTEIGVSDTSVNDFKDLHEANILLMFITFPVTQLGISGNFSNFSHP